jgi:hypothetical protein
VEIQRAPTRTRLANAVSRIGNLAATVYAGIVGPRLSSSSVVFSQRRRVLLHTSGSADKSSGRISPSIRGLVSSPDSRRGAQVQPSCITSGGGDAHQGDNRDAPEPDARSGSPTTVK